MNNFNNKIIFRKLFKDITSFFFVLLLSFGLITWIVQAVNFLDFVTEDGHGLPTYFKYTLFSLPKIFSKLTPVIFFISIFFILIKYENNNELKIYWFLGISRISIINRMFIFSFFSTIVLMIFTIFVVPSSQNKAREFIQDSNIDFFPSLITEKEFIDTVDGLTIFIENKDGEVYEDIYLKDKKDSFEKIIYAKKGQLINNDIQRALVLKNGKIIDINKSNITELYFDKTIFDLSSYVTKSTIVFKIQEKNTFDLIACYRHFSILKNKNSYYDEKVCNEDLLKEIESELYKRIVKPLYLIVLTFICGLLLLTSKEKNFNQKYIVTIFILGIITVVTSELFNSILEKNFYFLITAFIFPFVLNLILYLTILKKVK